MNMNADDLLADEAPAAPKLTQEDYARVAKLDAGIKQLVEEKAALYARIKAEHSEKGTYVHGNVIVKVTPRTDKDWAKTAEKFALGEDGTNVEYWEQEWVFNQKAVDDKDIVKKETILTLSVTQASN
jgi:hypothetical protein